MAALHAHLDALRSAKVVFNTYWDRVEAATARAERAEQRAAAANGVRMGLTVELQSAKEEVAHLRRDVMDEEAEIARECERRCTAEEATAGAGPRMVRGRGAGAQV